MDSFEELKLVRPLLNAVKSEGYKKPTPIQVQSIPHLLDGKDLLGCAQTGTGKTAAFALPILQRLALQQIPKGKRPIRVLVLTPTRELAAQIGDSFETYGKNMAFRHVVVFGGVGQRPQVDALRRGVDILVATPGRLLDLTAQGFVKYFAMEVFVLDEADRMLDMGFIHDVKKVVSALPEKRQTLLFSATMPREIKHLASSILVDPIEVSVAPPATTVELISQSVYFVGKPDKRALMEHLLKNPEFRRVLVFTRTKHGADKVTKILSRNRIPTKAIHGNKSQNARTAALNEFKNGNIRVLIATDIASRGLDIENVSHVINFDLPNEPESYVHRIGRTGRAGMDGIAISFCSEEERPYLRDIERLTKKWIDHAVGNPYSSHLSAPPPTNLDPKSGGTQVRKVAKTSSRNIYRGRSGGQHGGGQGGRYKSASQKRN